MSFINVFKYTTYPIEKWIQKSGFILLLTRPPPSEEATTASNSQVCAKAVSTLEEKCSVRYTTLCIRYDYIKVIRFRF